ncbi:MAG TPA: putative glycoside hydrolase [Gemmatimonadaceae bacterium]|nr:putative glycoside hydrolase [Gemmatimonadaceae bacterium]
MRRPHTTVVPNHRRATAAASLLLALAASACKTGEAAGGSAASDSAVAPSRAGALTPGSDSAAAATAPRALGAAPIVRALYVNRFAAQSARKMKNLIAVADSTEINALVIDMKDEFGLNYHSANPEFVKNEGAMGKIGNVRALLDTLKAHDILPIARIVVFKDSVTARVNPQWTIRREDGSIWRDHKGLAWVNPYHHELWDYNIGVAEELVKMGFGEVQFDYIRFPEPYKSLPTQVFPDASGRGKPETLAEFLRTARGRLSKLGVRTTADIFGLVTTVRGALEVGQDWEKLSPVTDVLLPMTYPSHYPPGSFGIPRPNAEPYKTIEIAIAKAHERDDKLGITGEHVRPWLQAFTLGAPRYGAEEMRQQKQAVYDAGYDGWTWWSPGSNYDIFLPALEKTLVSRKKAKGSTAAVKP